MDDKEFLSAGLWRPIKSGNNYSRLIKGTSCKKSSLSTGDTFLTIQHMYDWVQKHQHQTERLAPLLKGNSLRTTAANIYKFLYDHIQYKADGTLQVLKSPGCA